MGTSKPFDELLQLRSKLEQYVRDYPELTTEFHFPGSNFTGPGTHIVSRIVSGDRPNSRTDAIALLHDIDYLRFAGSDEIDNVDQLAIRRVIPELPSGYMINPIDLEGNLMRTGLNLRKKLGLRFDAVGKRQLDRVHRVGNYLRRYVLQHPMYKQIFDDYNIDLTQF